MKFFTLLFIFVSLACGDKTLTIATYNVENLFDLNKGDYRYKEYKPNGKSLWNKKNYKIKLDNISKVIKDIDADIIALQEIGSLSALKDLRQTLKQKGLYYQYYNITNKKPTAIKVAILSKIPFSYSKDLSVTYSYKYRNILETKFIIDSKELYLFINHWKSKAGPESIRIVSAKKLKERINKIGYEKNIILLGDFNSDYEEYIRFKRKRKHNDTNGKTGINHILRTLKQTTKANQTKYIKNNFYNLWYDTNKENRYSYIYRGKKEALDNILISQSLLDNKNISYVNNSILNFSKSYLFKKKNIYRWQTTRGKVKKHKGKGYSDHLPVIAKFYIE
ncbi:MAG: endonuclease/exonuclease/phosphatase family protein [Sulfurimonas sp.]|nr:endonuclease/exonuclease/phosphatase family protein [Sulfurimonas sp.]